MFGIPIKFADYEVHKYYLHQEDSSSKFLASTEPRCLVELFEQDKYYKNCNVATTIIKQEFIQEDVIRTYFNLEDLFAKLGGIGATLGILLKSFSAFFMIEFAILINGVIRRKQKEKLRLFKIKSMKNSLTKVEKRIKK